MHFHLRSLLRHHHHHHLVANYKSTPNFSPFSFSTPNFSPPLIHSYFHQIKNISTNTLPPPQPQLSPIDKESIRIQQILKLHITKPSNKLQTILSKCGISLTEDLVLNVLKRHQCDWKSTYTFFSFVCNGKISNGFSPSLRIYNEVINIFGRNKMLDMVNEVFDEMLKREGFVNDETWEVVVHRYAAAHCVDEAISLFWKRRDMGLEIDLVSFQTLLKWLCRYKHVEEAETFFYQEKGRFEDDIKTWNIILGGWCVRNNLHEAKRFWKDIMISKCRPDKYTFGVFINVLSKNGKVSRALKLLQLMWDKRCHPDMAICNSIIHGLCFKKRVPEALELLKTLKEKGYELNVVTYNTLIQHLCKIKRMEKVAEVLDEMKQQGIEPNDKTYSFLLSVARDPEEVYGILKRIEMSGCKLVIDTYNLLLRLFMEWGISDRLESTWREIEKSGAGHNETSYVIMVHGFYHKEKFEKALYYYHEMTSKVGIIPDPRTESLFHEMNEKLNPKKKQKPRRRRRHSRVCR